MSIFIENVDWSQNDSEIIIKIPIGGKKVTDNVIITDKFMKVNVHPYFYELFFEKPIRAEESSCKILETCIKCTMKKSINEQWTQLGKPSKVNGKSNEKCILNDIRKETRHDYEQKVQADCTNKQKERAQIKRDVMDKSIDRQQEIRKQIENAENSLKKEQLHQPIEDELEEPKVETSLAMPPIRSPGTINITFSERLFITPKRESQEQAEREWCAKQHEIMTKNVGFSDDDLNPDERDAQWLLRKGHEFLEKKNFLAAVSAFSSGIRMAEESADLFLGRAEAQFHLGNFKRCAEDCSDALDKFKPAVLSNLQQRVKCIRLRGKSLLELGFKEHGFKELQAALELDPLNDDLKQDIVKLKIE